MFYKKPFDPPTLQEVRKRLKARIDNTALQEHYITFKSGVHRIIDKGGLKMEADFPLFVENLPARMREYLEHRKTAGVQGSDQEEKRLIEYVKKSKPGWLSKALKKAQTTRAEGPHQDEVEQIIKMMTVLVLLERGVSETIYNSIRLWPRQRQFPWPASRSPDRAHP